MENSVYYSCGPTVQPTCLDVLTDSVLNDTGTCMEGCLCPEGLVRDGDKCVNETDCGCIENDMYYSVSYPNIRNPSLRFWLFVLLCAMFLSMLCKRLYAFTWMLSLF